MVPVDSRWINTQLKFATMMGMGRVMQRTPQIAHNEATSFPAAVLGAISPYPKKKLSLVN